MKLTINEIAEMAQVAKSTVSKALNGQKGVSQETRQRILNIAKQVNFQPNFAAKALAQKKSNIIGFVLPHEAGFSLSGFYWAGVVTAAAEEVSKRGNNLMIISPLENEEGHILEIQDTIRSNSLDGLIIGAEQLDTKTLVSIMAEEIPFVFIGQNSTLQHYCVDVNNREGSDKLVTQMIKNGFKKIGCITGPEDYQYTRERVEGFNDAMKRAGLDSSRIMHTSYYEEDARKTTLKMIEENPDIDALYITAGGEFTLNIFETLRFSGISPKKLGLGVFDDSRIFDFLDFSVTTAKQPLNQIGAMATQLLFEQISGHTPEEKINLLPVEIILR
ncbi:MAG: LacI family DNA-binding transcriptional regulator [Spirochaetaceae bacterium]|nr:LacI family DNA-binding transcriptional regulator [Spirochaetaceae bacterium]